MPLIGPFERQLVNLEEDISPEDMFLYVKIEDALSMLKKRTGQDFGYYAAKWREWLIENGFIEPGKVHY